MGSDYRRNSPGSNMLNIGSMGNTPGFGGGSQSGSDFDFGTPQSLSIDTMMHGGEMNGTTSMANYRAPAGMPANMQTGFGGVYDPAMFPHAQGHVQGTHTQHRGSNSSLHDGQSPTIDRQHRLSIGSDSGSPDGLQGYGNSFANTSHPNMPNEYGNNKSNETPSHPAPSWSELKTKAGKERKRLPLACIACRRKKIRCSGEKPACKHCLRSRIPCVYKVTARKAAPRTDYMAMLDKRLKRMEERVIKIIPKEEQGIVESTGRAVVKPAIPAPPPKSAGSSKKRVAESAFGEELDDWANTDVPNPQTKKDTSQDASAEHAKGPESDEHSLLQEGADKLPSKEVQEHLAEIFFDYVYGQSYPLLHKPSFIRRHSQGLVPPVLMLAVCAISARFSNHPEVRTEATEPAFLRGEIWASAAREIALRRYDSPNITILIVYLILGLHEFGTCQGGRSWMFGGMAQRMAYALQLHRDLDYDPKSLGLGEKSELTFTDREIRRRTMWSCFLMDRFNSSGTERPIFIGDQYIRAQLPIKEKYYQMEITGPTEDLEGDVPNPVEPETGHVVDAQDNMGVAAYLVRLVAIWGKLINYLNLGGKERDKHPMWAEGSIFQSIKSAAKEWKENLPPSLVYSADNVQNHASERIANQFIFLHIVYNQVILFMNRFALPTPGARTTFPKEMPSEFRSESSRNALEAANQISMLVHESMDHNVVAPFAGYSAFFSSTVHIYGAFSENAALEASSKQNLAWNVKYLTKMKKYWGMFHFMTENLRDLYKRHADAAKSGGSKASGNKDATDQNIFQYGDWFDRYPHGVSGSDYEEPSVDIKKEPGSDAVLGQKSDLQTVEEFFSKMTPPSRAQYNQQQQASQRKMAKKKRSKSDAKRADAPSNVDAQPDLKQEQSQSSQQLPEGIAQPQIYHGIPSFMQQASSHLPHGYQQVPNHPMMNMATPTQQVMSQLDRQMVLNSYGGTNASSNAPFPTLNQPIFDSNNHGMADNFDFNAFTPNANTPNLWSDPNSTAWFMPFNMDPPAIGEDNNFFNGNIDWSNIGGFGDFPATMPPTGMTPGGNSGHSNMGGDASEPGSGMSGMQ